MYELIEIGKSSIHGKGVFAKMDIPKHTKLTCDVLTVDETVLLDYQYPWDGRKHSSICIGFGSFFNHMTSPNVEISSIDRVNLTKTFIILDDIKMGEELGLYYNDSFEKNEKKC